MANAELPTTSVVTQTSQQQEPEPEKSPPSRWIKWRIPVALFLIADAAIAITAFAIPDLHWMVRNCRPSPLGVAHIILWTLLPPTWFFYETFVVNRQFLPDPDKVLNVEEAARRKAQQDLMKLQHDYSKAFWAAVLATMVLLASRMC